jgi:hypothetical protein
MDGPAVLQPCQYVKLPRGVQAKEHAISQKLSAAIAVIGIDIRKNSFHIVGPDHSSAIVLRQKWSRGQVETRLASLPPSMVGMEACVGAHHLIRKLQMLMPAKYVRPYSKGQKNDFREAKAICKAVQRPTMKFVATKTADQVDLQALHRVRDRLVGQRTSVINHPRLPAGAGHHRAARTAFTAVRVAGHPRDAHRCALASQTPSEKRFIAFVAKRCSGLYTVNDQKPLTGGSCPFGKVTA